jgi:hypothetical protein
MTAQLPSRRVAYGLMAIAASVVVLVGVLTLLFTKQHSEPIIAANSLQMITAVSVAPNPERVAALYNLHEQVHAANCSYPQALMLAPEQHAPFIENVVDGNVSDIKPESMVMVSQLYQKVDCYYPPAAMLL